MCRWVCSTEPEDWEPEELNPLDVNVKVEEDEDAPKSKKMKEDGKVIRELTKWLQEEKLKLLSHRQEEGKQLAKDRVAVTCCDISDSRDFAVVGFEDGVFILVGLPTGELIQQLRYV